MYVRSEAEQRWANYSDKILLFLGLLFLFAYATPIIWYELPENYKLFFHNTEILIWIIFAFDLVIRLFLAENKRSYFVSHLLDIASVIIPLLRPLRSLRVLVVFLRLLEAGKNSRKKTFTTYTLITIFFSWFVAGLAITDAERGIPGSNIENVIDGWWWAGVTIFTVGYGDKFPISGEGRIVASLLMIGGIAFISVMTANIASWFIEERNAEEERDQVQKQIEYEVSQIHSEINEIKNLISDKKKKLKMNLEY